MLELRAIAAALASPSNIVNALGVSVVTVPFAYYDDGTPSVLPFIGDPLTEAELLAYAYDFEQATKARVHQTCWRDATR